MISLVGDNVGQLSFYGQGAGKYPTGTAVAHDVIDIVSGDVALLKPGARLTADNDAVSRAYYVRTNADFPRELIESIEVIDGEKYIITKNVSINEIHRISDDISKKDGEIFLAGIER